MWRDLLRVGLLLAMTGVILFFGLTRSDEPWIACDKAQGARGDYKILVVGESWAAGGRFFPELPQAVSRRLGGRGVDACSLGFSGRTTKLIYFEMAKKFPKERIYSAFGGEKPDKVIFMIGVNDEIQHVGAASYVEYTKKLTEYFSDVDDVEIISLPRVNERGFKSPNMFSRLKRTILRCVYDNCDLAANDVYRVALWRDHPELQMIEFDNFIPRYEGHENCFELDGVHLTDACLHEYGKFIGKMTPLASGVAQSP